MQIAVIGAGISGLVCARRLMAGGHHVVVTRENSGITWWIPEHSISP
ncbi:MAG: hypothetical protein EBS69_01705 [Verrucomicrobia bacterium]|nr:hypothetical protein [Verrucomicrobiota bacterium]